MNMANASQSRVEADSSLLEAAAVLLEHAGGQLLTTNLNKALFYFDLHCLLETGKRATDAIYVALRHGPVVESYSTKLIDALEKVNIAMHDDEDPNYKPIVLLHPVEVRRLNETQVALAKHVAEWAKSKTATQLSDYSHDNLGWKAAFERIEGTPINLHLAMQQLADADPWLDESLTADEEAAFATPDGSDFVAW
jgi:uncharacterized phage-associated protein